MNYPVFLDIEASTPDEGQYPVAMTWSLPDGQLKSVLISPDDDWEPWDNCDPEVDVQYLMDQGASGLDVIRELNMDLSGQTVFVDGLDDDEALLELLFESFGDSPDFEIATLTQLYTDESLEAILEHRRAVAETLEQNNTPSEDNVRTMLHQYVERNPNS